MCVGRLYGKDGVACVDGTYECCGPNQYKYGQWSSNCPRLLSSLSIAVMSEIACTSKSAATRGSRFFPNAECPAKTCVNPPFLMFSTSSGA